MAISSSSENCASNLRHFGRVGCVERRAGGLRIAAVARRERADQRLLARACLAGKRLRLLRGGVGGRDRVLRHRKIDVGTEHQRLAPEAHGAVGIELLRHAERALRLAVIERIGETQALIEISLCALVRGRDLVSDGAEAGPQRRLGFRECRRGAGCAHLGAWHFGLCQAKHHVRRAGRGRRVADRKIRPDQWRRCVYGGCARTREVTMFPASSIASAAPPSAAALRGNQ